MLQKLFWVPLLLAANCLPALAGSSTLVISQVYGGGGNAGATYKNDFVEVFNRGTTSVNQGVGRRSWHCRSPGSGRDWDN